MSSIFFTLCLSCSLVSDCILLNLAQNIKDKTFNILSSSFLVLSIFSSLIVFLAWLSDNKYIKKLLIINCYIIKISMLLFFLTIHYYGDYVESYYGFVTFINFILSFALFLTNKSTEEPVRKISPIESIYIVTETENTINNTTCSICLEDLLYKEKVHITKCIHHFHPECFKKLLDSNINSCPICRTTL